MKLYLQFGHGMMAHTKELLQRWNGDGGVILSPRDLDSSQLEKVAGQAAMANADVLVDPQCYVRAADHHRLTGHEYWDAFQSNSTVGILNGSGASALLSAVQELNANLDTTHLIVPGILASEVDRDWLELQTQLTKAARAVEDQRPLLATVAIGAEALVDEAQVEAIVERSSTWDVDGFYVVAETPGPYLVEDPTWLANLMILVSGLKLTKRYVLVGYSNHQMLALASARVDAIASGNWQNVRAFTSDKFITPEEDEISRRAKGGWYYCATALSEYKMNYLDIARTMGLLGKLKPAPSKLPSYATPLFSGAVPSGVNWGESNAFRHYLDALRSQARDATQATYDGTVEHHKALLDQAEVLLAQLRKSGVRGQDRDFNDYLDVNRAALVVHNKARGARLRREWSTL